VIIKSLANNMPSLNVSMHVCSWSMYDINVFGGNVHVYVEFKRKGNLVHLLNQSFLRTQTLVPSIITQMETKLV
jgi:hypothetical protein